MTSNSPLDDGMAYARCEFLLKIYLQKLLKLVGNFVDAYLNAGLVFLTAGRTGCTRRAYGFVADFDW